MSPAPTGRSPPASAPKTPQLRPRQSRPPPPAPPRPRRGQGHADIRQTKEYKAAARKWTSTIVALPIVLYTSYILYERLYRNQGPKTLPGHPRPKSEQDQSSSS